MRNMMLALLLTSSCTPATPAWAADGGRWNDQPPEVRKWFPTVMQPDNEGSSCCGEADAYEADTSRTEDDRVFAKVTKGDGKFPTGFEVEIPPSKIAWEHGNPTGHVVLFLGSSGQVYCYVPNGGV